jgi:hypothetical protein
VNDNGSSDKITETLALRAEKHGDDPDGIEDRQLVHDAE